MKRVLVVRLDSDGDVLLSGPAVRAVAAGADEVVAVVGPRGRQAAGLLPGVDAVAEWRCPWVDAEPPPVTREDTEATVAMLAALDADEAVVLTSFHQSPLPTALVLRLAGVARITAASVDYPGSLLDVRLRPGEDLGEELPEAERALAIAQRAGYTLPPGDDGRLAVTVDADARREAADALAAHDVTGEYVVLHPGASVPARAWSPHRAAEGVAALASAGHRVVVTGAPGERALTAEVAGHDGVDLGGRTGFGALAAVLAGARAVVVGNTGPAHLAAAVGVPVVSLFAPVVPPERWAPYGVRRILLGDQGAPCRGTRARNCPVPGHPCLDDIRGSHVVDAVARLIDGE
ncbi:ADP-heptose:LPS heptosyltransferase [Actinomycetospora succinea]|uniref:ADP-heptose:LPS heptosyltransferase n=1 Tax=Actinomycetospora succinea TaxID=663603 RepID=A0A4R6UHS0_9PSEU|nr:glycosyltransferase family 9 protein [Actinomycetospora succinea]TDQ46420.1 ADP-heptose:LPS heptosyltransferase [Actinomycetospora succinea]